MFFVTHYFTRDRPPHCPMTSMLFGVQHSTRMLNGANRSIFKWKCAADTQIKCGHRPYPIWAIKLDICSHLKMVVAKTYLHIQFNSISLNMELDMGTPKRESLLFTSLHGIHSVLVNPIITFNFTLIAMSLRAFLVFSILNFYSTGSIQRFFEMWKSFLDIIIKLCALVWNASGAEKTLLLT